MSRFGCTPPMPRGGKGVSHGQRVFSSSGANGPDLSTASTSEGSATSGAEVYGSAETACSRSGLTAPRQRDCIALAVAALTYGAALYVRYHEWLWMPEQTGPTALFSEHGDRVAWRSVSDGLAMSLLPTGMPVNERARESSIFATPSGSAPDNEAQGGDQQYVSFRIEDARRKRIPAFINAEASAKMGVVFQAYARLRNNDDPRCFFYKAGPPYPRELVMSSQTVSEAHIANGSTLLVTSVADDSEVCGQGLTSDATVKKYFNGDPVKSAKLARLARLFLGCALADAAEPDWRRSAAHLTTLTAKARRERLAKLRPPIPASSSVTAFFTQVELQARIEAANPWRQAEIELRDALWQGSDAARIALAKLVVVAAHFEARPTFLDDAREAVAGDETYFAEAVAMGTAIAAAKASRLLVRECASENADLDVVASAIAAGADVDMRSDDFGRATSLVLAARRGHSQVVGALISAGADVTIANDDGLTAAHVAIDSGTKKFLNSAGVDLPDKWDDDLPKTSTATATAVDDTTQADLLQEEVEQAEQDSPLWSLSSTFETISVAIVCFVALHRLVDACGAALRRAVPLCRPSFNRLTEIATAVTHRASYVIALKLRGAGRSSTERTGLSTINVTSTASSSPSQTMAKPPRQSSSHDANETMTLAPLAVTDELANLDLSTLPVPTLDRLDKILPELQRRVVRELLSRESRVAASNCGPRSGDDCVICLATSRCVAFDCGHLCCCAACAEAVVECPVCRSPVTSRHRIFNTT